MRHPLGMVILVADPNHRERIGAYEVNQSDDVFPTESGVEDLLAWMDDDVSYVEI